MALITINGANTNVTATGEDVVTVVQNSTTLDSLSDVETNTLATGDLLVYDTTSSMWLTNKALVGDYTVDGLLSGNGGTALLVGNTVSGTSALNIKRDVGDGFDGEVRFVTFSNTGSSIQSSLQLATDQNKNFIQILNTGDATAHTNGTTDIAFRLKGENATLEASDQTNTLVDLTLNANSVIVPNGTSLITDEVDGGLRITLRDRDYTDKDSNTITRPYLHIESDWSNLFGGLSTTTMLGCANLGSISGNVQPFNAATLFTTNGYEYITIGAQQSSGSDNATHNSQMFLRGEENLIRSVERGSITGTLKQLTINSDQLNIDSNGQTSFTVHPDYTTISGDAATFSRRNASDGTNDSNILDGSEVKFNFNIRSADGTAEQLIGGFQAVTHSSNGNTFQITMDNQAQTSQVNTFTLHETHTSTQQPLQFPSFTTTERNAMTPSEGWVLFNNTTSKLQVYDGTSWVDLH